VRRTFDHRKVDGLVGIMKLAEDHWAYVKSVLEAHNEDEIVIEKIGFHYKTGMEHGYKHGIEDSNATC
jgi:hypothetical protein